MPLWARAMAPLVNAAWRFRWPFPVGEDGEQARRKARSKGGKPKSIPYTDEKADFGPLVTGAALERIKASCRLASTKALNSSSTDAASKCKATRRDLMGACLFDRVKPSMRIYPRGNLRPGAFGGSRA